MSDLSSSSSSEAGGAGHPAGGAAAGAGASAAEFAQRASAAGAGAPSSSSEADWHAAGGAGSAPFSSSTSSHAARVVWVDAPASLAAMLADLAAHAAVAVDLEGVSLGREGEVAIVQISTGRHSPVYLVDVCALGAAAFGDGAPGSLRALLEDASVAKLMWDVRSDSNALFFHFGVRMAGVVDLQVYDCVARLVRGARVDKVSGLGYVLERTGLAQMSGAEKEAVAACKAASLHLFAPDYGGSYEVWKARPLPSILLEYCSDSRYFFTIRASYEAQWGRGATAALEPPIAAATARRIDFSCTLGFSRNNRDVMIAADPLLIKEAGRVIQQQRGGHGGKR
jgi:exonuclease 3'-5' domain-containing protein 1